MKKHRIERGASLRALANFEIEDQIHELAFSVIAHRAVRRVLVGPIQFDPRVERRSLERMNEPPGRRIQIHELARNVIEVLVDGAELRESQDAPIEIARPAFEPPEKTRVVFFFVAIRREARGSNAFHVPEMKIFVRDEREQVEESPRRSNAFSDAMSEDDVRCSRPPREREVQEKRVAVVREIPAERALGLDDRFRRVEQTRGVASGDESTLGQVERVTTRCRERRRFAKSPASVARSTRTSKFFAAAATNRPSGVTCASLQARQARPR